MKLFSKLFLVGSFSLTLFSCDEHNIPADDECISDEVISYSGDVAEIVQTVCATAGCHNGSLGAERNWLDFNKFKDHASEVRRRITLPAGEPDHMPRKGALTRDEIQKIICWIDQGAQNN
jgi:hypothetical protein